MKKTIASVLAFILLFAVLLSACGDTAHESSVENSASSDMSGESSFAVSKEDISVNFEESDLLESSDMTEDSSEEISSESSVEDSSAPEFPPEDEDGLMPIYNINHIRDAKGYRIAFTKESALSATECITNCNVGITAVYDGIVTRFFDSVNGAYFHAISGKYLYPCCDGTFLSGDLNSHNSSYSIRFVRDKNDNSIVTYTLNDHDGHGLEDVNAIYSEADGKVYYYDHALYGSVGEGTVDCRYYSSEDSIYLYYMENGIVDIDTSALGKYGIVKDGSIVLPFEYDLVISGQTNENVGVYLAVKDGRYYYVSSSGFNLTPDGFDCGSQPYNNRAWVFNGSQGYILEFN